MNTKPGLASHNYLKSEEDDVVEGNSLSVSQYVVVELEDENGGPERDIDLSLFAPVEFSESEIDDEDARQERDNSEDVKPPETQPSSSFQECHEDTQNVRPLRRRRHINYSETGQESNLLNTKICSHCNTAIHLYARVCKKCRAAQRITPKFRKKRTKNYTEAHSLIESGNFNNMFDETNLLLYKWQQLGMYPMFLLGWKRCSKVLTHRLCPITFEHPQSQETLDTIRQIFSRVINAEIAAESPVIKSPAQPPQEEPVIPSVTPQQAPIFQSLVQPPVIQRPVSQSVSFTSPTVKGITDDDLRELRRIAPHAAIFTSMDLDDTDSDTRSHQPEQLTADKSIQHMVQVKQEKLD